MHLEQQLVQFQDVPVRHETVASLLHGYDRPNDKISTWLKNQTLIAIKRGLYVVNPSLTGTPVSLSLEYALISHQSCTTAKSTGQG